MVTPRVFNLILELDSPGFTIERVYGSPEANEATGEIMKINTLFPSETHLNESKCGIVLLKLKKKTQDMELNLEVSYGNRVGEEEESRHHSVSREKTQTSTKTTR
ncbi:MAG: hypothetical protein B6U72_03180 [Candidatus Altiarchaeales archaeon ex4484_2]|nr:MAG: hypothetical protein B6U72_03180 [Candidatus Altiarchaeales archaeon ex4484_2]